jgi:hypothetical protein
VTASRVFDEWADGWHRAEAEDCGAASSQQDHPDWPAEVQRGYRDWWKHPRGHERRVLQADHRQYQGAALLPDPELGVRL